MVEIIADPPKSRFQKNSTKTPKMPHQAHTSSSGRFARDLGRDLRITVLDRIA